jgi:hypothetical protein
MADNLAAGVANSILAALVNGSSFTGFSPVYVKLHVGAPGAAGTSNPAGNTVRQSAGGFATPAGGVTSNSAAVNWTAVSTSETYTHVTLWDASTGGTFIASGSITAGAILAGQNFQIPAGGMTVTLPVAS